jgi:uncharacterized delta-60 repeat protein
MRRTTVSILAAVLLGAVATPVRAAPGDLDTFFAGDGIATAFPNGAIATAVAIDHHERILVAGYTVRADPDLALARFTPAGRLDPSFDGDGKVVVDLGGNDYAFDVAIADDGGIVVVGERDAAEDRVAVARLRPNGRLDPTFGGDGVVLTSFGRRFQSANAVGLMTDGRIVIAGSTSNGSTGRSALARYRTDGGLDPTFGDDGRVTVDLSPSGERFDGLVVLPGGAVVAAGSAERGLVPAFSVARFEPDGALDLDFGKRGAGSSLIDVGAGSDVAHALTVQPDGRIVVVGSATGDPRGDWAIARLGPKGRLDPGFSADGVVVTAASTGAGAAFGVVAQPNGKLLVVGRVHRTATRDDLAVLRLKPGGGRDLRFGVGGIATVDVGGRADSARDAVLQANGKLVVVGDASIGGRRRFVATRLRTR